MKVMYVFMYERVNEQTNQRTSDEQKRKGVKKKWLNKSLTISLGLLILKSQ